MMITAGQLWDAIEWLYDEDGSADRIQPAVIAKLIDFNLVELGAARLPHLTERGQKCYVIFESGNESMTEIDDWAAMEEQCWN
jgi:hypothetical protein